MEAGIVPLDSGSGANGASGLLDGAAGIEAQVCTDLEQARENFDRHTAIVRSEVDEELETLLKAANAFVVSSPAEPPDQGTANVISQYPWSCLPAGGRP